MEAKAIARYVRVTPRKADQVLQLIRGKRVDHATEVLLFTPKQRPILCPASGRA
jgi:large subunit ribosomal protein L22